MPTANSADPIQPTENLVVEKTTRGKRRFATLGLGLVLGLGFALPAQSLLAPSVEGRARPNNCKGWTSTDRPPDYIRVLRTRSGRVQRVPFRKYVVTVMGKEWPSYLPQAVIEAGAVAVKQYGWYHARGHTSITRDGQCYDVRDGTGDQLYKPGKARVTADHHAALAATWNVRLLKNGKLFMTGYRRGGRARCGRDRTGWKLYAMSAKRCANAGYNFREILRKYYSPNLVILDGPYGSGSSEQRSDSAQPTLTGSQTVDDRNGAIDYSGDWRRANRDSAHRNTVSSSSDPGATATFRFVGTSLDLIGKLGPRRGMVDVFVDGTRMDRINMYSATKRAQSVFFSRDWNRERSRVVMLVVVGRPQRQGVSFDGARIQ